MQVIHEDFRDLIRYAGQDSGHDVYVVGGKVILFEPDVYDLSDRGDAEDLVGFAGSIDAPGSGVVSNYGGDSACVLWLDPGGSVVAESHHVGELAADVRARARKELSNG